MRELKSKFRGNLTATVLALGVFSAGVWLFTQAIADPLKNPHGKKNTAGANTEVTFQNAAQMVVKGQQIFRFDTFGDEIFWGDTLQLHQAIEGSGFGGVGAGISPNAALGLGLKVDVQALPETAPIPWRF